MEIDEKVYWRMVDAVKKWAFSWRFPMDPLDIECIASDAVLIEMAKPWSEESHLRRKCIYRFRALAHIEKNRNDSLGLLIDVSAEPDQDEVLADIQDDCARSVLEMRMGNMSLRDIFSATGIGWRKVLQVMEHEGDGAAWAVEAASEWVRFLRDGTAPADNMHVYVQEAIDQAAEELSTDPVLVERVVRERVENGGFVAFECTGDNVTVTIGAPTQAVIFRTFSDRLKAITKANGVRNG